MNALKIAVALLILTSQLHAESIQLLTDHIGSSPQMIAIGNIEGMFSGPSSIFDNTAAITKSSPSFYSMQTQLADPDTKFLCLAYSMPFLEGHLGLGIMNTHTSGIDKTGEDNFSEYYSASTFGVKDELYTLGYQKMIDTKTSLGVTLKYIDQDLYETRGTGINADVGLIINEAPYRISVSAKNIFRNSKITYTEDNAKRSLPFQVVLGGKYQFLDFGVMGQFKYIEDTKLIAKSCGLEYTPGTQLFSVFAGWKEIPVNNHTEAVSSIGAQLDLKQVAVSIGYDFSDFIDHNSRSYFSIEINL